MIHHGSTKDTKPNHLTRHSLRVEGPGFVSFVLPW